MIHVIATINVVSGRRDEFLAEFRRVVPLVLEEEGCLEYGPTVDVETNIDAQPTTRGDTVTVIEKWEDLDALEKHLIAPHMIEYRKRVKELVADASIRVLRPA